MDDGHQKAAHDDQLKAQYNAHVRKHTNGRRSTTSDSFADWKLNKQNGSVFKGELSKATKEGKGGRHTKYFELYPSKLICWGNKQSAYEQYDRAASVVAIELKPDHLGTLTFTLLTDSKTLILTAPDLDAFRKWLAAVNLVLHGKPADTNPAPSGGPTLPTPQQRLTLSKQHVSGPLGDLDGFGSDTDPGPAPIPDGARVLEVHFPDSYGGGVIPVEAPKDCTVLGFKRLVLSALHTRQAHDPAVTSLTVANFSFGVASGAGADRDARSSAHAIAPPGGSRPSMSTTASNALGPPGTPTRGSTSMSKSSIKSKSAQTKPKSVGFSEADDIKVFSDLDADADGAEVLLDRLVPLGMEDMPVYFFPDFDSRDLGMFKQAVLLKQGKYRHKDWKQVLCQLHQGQFSYYKSTKARRCDFRVASCCTDQFAKSQICRTCWDPIPYQQIMMFGSRVGPSPGPDHEFTITQGKTGRTFAMRAQNAADRTAWITACQKSGATHQIESAQPNDEQVLAAFYSADANTQSNKPQTLFMKLYAKYVPFVVRNRFIANPDPLTAPEIVHFQGLVAFVDISGFTKLSEKLVKQHGEEGAELLNKYISGYFERLIGLIVQYGGDIIKFAGDAMQVLWQGDSTEAGRPRSDSPSSRRRDQQVNTFLQQLALRATSCCQKLIEECNGFTPAGMSPKEVYLTLHCGVGVGDLISVFVGGLEGKWMYYLAGEPILQMSKCVDEASSGELVVSARVAAMLESEIQGKKLPSGSVCVKKIIRFPRISNRNEPYVTKDMQPAVSAFVQDTVMNMPKQSVWMYEFRECTLMFLALEGIDYARTDVLYMIQDYVIIVQVAVAKHKGIVARLIQDDKGTRFKIAFGMPGSIRGGEENVPVRAVRCALEISSQLRRHPTHPCRPAIGVATGTVFCGDAGSSVRAEYTAVGYIVVLAARLMSKAGFGGTYCDTETYDKSKHLITFEPKEPVVLKGVAEPVPIYLPHELDDKSQGKMAALLGLEDAHGFRYRAKAKGKYEAASTRRKSANLLDGKLGDDAHGHKAGTTPHPIGKQLSTGVDQRHPHAAPKLKYEKKSQRQLLPKSDEGENRQHVLGRAKEMRIFLDTLNDVMETQHTHCIIVQGEAFMGKTSLINDFIDRVEREFDIPCASTNQQVPAEELNIPQDKVQNRFMGVDAAISSWAHEGPRHLTFQDKKAKGGYTQRVMSVKFKGPQYTDGDTIYKKASEEGLAMWKVFFAQVFEHCDPESASELNKQAEQHILAAMAEHKTTINLEDRNASPATTWLLDRLNDWQGAEGVRIMVLFGLNDCKEPALRLFKTVVTRVPKLLVIATTRPLTSLRHPDAYTEICTLPFATPMELGAFSLREAALVASYKLRAMHIRDVPEALLNYIAIKSQGHPVLLDNVLRVLTEEAIAKKVLFKQLVLCGDEGLKAVTGALGWVQDPVVPQDSAVWHTLVFEKAATKRPFFGGSLKTHKPPSPTDQTGGVSLANASSTPSFPRASERGKDPTAAAAAHGEGGGGGEYQHNTRVRKLDKARAAQLDGLKGMKELHIGSRQDLIGRFDLLPQEHLFILKIAAVVGDEFDVGLLTYLYEEETARLEDYDEAAKSNLTEDSLSRQRFIRERCVELCRVSILESKSANTRDSTWPQRGRQPLQSKARAEGDEGDSSDLSEDDVKDGTGPEVFSWKYGYFRDCIFHQLPVEHRKRVSRRIAVHLRPELIDRRVYLMEQMRILQDKMSTLEDDISAVNQRLEDMDNVVSEQGGYSEGEIISEFIDDHGLVLISDGFLPPPCKPAL